jgi:hypothetical protein
VQLGPHFAIHDLCPSGCYGLSDAQRSAARAFLSASDFIGVSVYPETPEALAPHMLEWQIYRLKNMIQDKLWLDITPLGSKGQILALEFGWGGGISDHGDSPATTGWQVASNSWVSCRRRRRWGAAAACSFCA